MKRAKQTILVDVNHIGGAADGGAVAVGGVVVTTVELIQNQGRAVTANVLDLCQLVVLHEVAGWVTRVRGQQHLRATSDFLGDLIGVDVVVILLRQRDGNGSNLCQSGLVSTTHTQLDSPAEGSNVRS